MNRFLEHIPHFVALWKWSQGKRLFIAAGFFVAMEFVVTSGYPLPYSDKIPQVWRAFGISMIIFARVVLGYLASQKAENAK